MIISRPSPLALEAPHSETLWPRRALIGLTAAVWLATTWLARAFLTSDFTLRVVAENSRAGAPWYYRLAALWGNAPGSLLLFAAIVLAVGTTAGRARPSVFQYVVGGTGLALTTLAIGVARPFERPGIPPIAGFGLTPILEHPAMAIHPPMLYIGLAATLPAFVYSALGAPHDVVRRWALVALATITLAMALGGWWSYAEQGWGGYWAWDPVENGSFAPWLGCLIVIHRQPSGRRPTDRRLAGGRSDRGLSDRERWDRSRSVGSRRLDGMAPWVLALAGAAVARSGAVPSVHAFADAPVIGWSLAGLVVATIVAGLLLSTTRPGARRSNGRSCRDPDPAEPLAPAREVVAAVTLDPDADEERAISPMNLPSIWVRPGAAGPAADPDGVSLLDDHRPPPDVRPAAADWRRYPRVLAAGVLAIVVTGVVVPLIARAVGDRRIAVGGSFFARLTLPFGLLAAAVLVTMAICGRRAAPWWGWVSHLGFVILLAGIAGSTFDRSAVTTIAAGERQVVAGLDVTNVGLDVRHGPRSGTTAVILTLDVAGHRLAPGLVSYPERGGILAETDMVSRPWRDIQVVLLDARDDGRAVIEVRVKPLVELIWLGALMVAAGAIAGVRRARGAPSTTVVPSTVWRSRHEPAHA